MWEVGELKGKEVVLRVFLQNFSLGTSAKSPLLFPFETISLLKSSRSTPLSLLNRYIIYCYPYTHIIIPTF